MTPGYNWIYERAFEIGAGIACRRDADGRFTYWEAILPSGARYELGRESKWGMLNCLAAYHELAAVHQRISREARNG